MEAYLQSQPKERLNPRWLDEEIAKIAAELESRPRYVYGNRDRDYTWDGQYAPEEPPAADLEMDMTMEEPMPLRNQS